MSFQDWLSQPEPEWKDKLENCDPRVFEELQLKKEEVHDILEKLCNYEVL